jgi:hypothetical protein
MPEHWVQYDERKLHGINYGDKITNQNLNDHKCPKAGLSKLWSIIHFYLTRKRDKYMFFFKLNKKSVSFYETVYILEVVQFLHCQYLKTSLEASSPHTITSYCLPPIFLLMQTWSTQSWTLDSTSSVLYQNISQMQTIHVIVGCFKFMTAIQVCSKQQQKKEKLRYIL